MKVMCVCVFHLIVQNKKISSIKNTEKKLDVIYTHIQTLRFPIKFINISQVKASNSL